MRVVNFLRPMDQNVLKSCNVLILTGLTQTPTANPDTMLGELCMAVGKPLIIYFGIF